MENEWKVLDINNLPPDILVGDYEFQWYCTLDNKWRADTTVMTAIQVLTNINNRSLPNAHANKHRYRKRQPEPPSHEEITTKWWKTDGEWFRVVRYAVLEFDVCYMFSAGCWKAKDWFTGRESADIPPED